jgi:hypothetical protein
MANPNPEIRIPARIEDRLKVLEARMSTLDRKVERYLHELGRLFLSIRREE